MKAFLVATVARQIDGEYVFVRMERGFFQSANADEYAKNLSKNFNDTIQVPGVGPVPCSCERGIFEIDIEGEPVSIDNKQGA